VVERAALDEQALRRSFVEDMSRVRQALKAVAA
jgi:hypothetical protein